MGPPEIDITDYNLTRLKELLHAGIRFAERRPSVLPSTSGELITHISRLYLSL